MGFGQAPLAPALAPARLPTLVPAVFFSRVGLKQVVTSSQLEGLQEER